MRRTPYSLVLRPRAGHCHASASPAAHGTGVPHASSRSCISPAALSDALLGLEDWYVDFQIVGDTDVVPSRLWVIVERVYERTSRGAPIGSRHGGPDATV